MVLSAQILYRGTWICIYARRAFAGLICVAHPSGWRACNTSTCGAWGKRSSVGRAAPLRWAFRELLLNVVISPKKPRLQGTAAAEHGLLAIPFASSSSFLSPHFSRAPFMQQSYQELHFAADSEGSVLPAQRGAAQLSLQQRRIKEGPWLILCQPASLALYSCLWLCCFIVLFLAVTPVMEKHVAL